MTHAQKLGLLGCLLGAAACGGDRVEVATYRVSGYLVPDAPGPCADCSGGLALDAVRADGTGPHRRFPSRLAAEAGLRFRSGVEQVVEVETRRGEAADEPGGRQRVSRVLEEKPVPAGTRVELRFPAAAPGSYAMTVSREGEEVRLRDGTSTLRLWCTDSALCDQLARLELGKQGFVLELTYSGIPDGPLTAEALRLEP